MDTHSRPWRRLVAALTTTLVVALSVVVPLLDRDRPFDGSALEAEHHGSSCVVVHDHTICAQFSANLALAPDSPDPRRIPARANADVVPAPDRPTTVEPGAAHLPRAPPSPRA